MAANKKLEVVQPLPTPDPSPSIEEMLSDRLADEIAADIDIAKLAKFTIGKLGSKLKDKFIAWVTADFQTQGIALNEIEAAALPSSDEVKAA